MPTPTCHIPSETEDRRHVGIFHEISPNHDVVVGREVAVSQQLLALSAHSQRHRFTLFCPPRQLSDLRATLPEADTLSLADQTRLAGDIDSFNFAAWHEAQFRVSLPLAARRRSSRPFPITWLHHTISYKSLLHDTFTRLLLGGARPYDSIVCTSYPARDALRRILDHTAHELSRQVQAEIRYVGRFDHIPLAVDTERFRPMDRGQARAEFHIEPDAFVLLWIGRLSLIDKADLLPLLQTFGQLRGANPTRHLLLVCAGTQRPGEQYGDVLRQYAAAHGLGDHVRIIKDRESFMPRTPLLYNCADVFVSPIDNVQETFGLTPVEAMACGIPQVVAQWDGYRDTVLDGETGFQVPTYWADCTADIDRAAPFSESAYDHLALASSVVVDPGAWRNAVQGLIDDSDLRQRMADASRKRAVQHFAWPKVVSAYESLWEELADQARHDSSPRPSEGAYDEPSYFQFFQGFASNLLNEEARYRLTATGRELVQGGKGLPLPYNEQFHYLDLNLLKRLLTGLHRLDGQGQPLTVRQARTVIAKGDDLLAKQVVRHLLWLHKYDYIEPI